MGGSKTSLGFLVLLPIVLFSGTSSGEFGDDPARGVGEREIGWAAAAAAKSLQSCPTLCDPIDGSSPGSPVPGILQARTLEWVAMSFSNGL